MEIDMPYDIFSVRTKQEADPYRYDDIPEGLRNTIFHILKNVMENMEPKRGIGEWGELWNDCCQEKGLRPHRAYDYDCRKFFYEHLMRIEKVEDVLDMVDIAFQFITFQFIKGKYLSEFSSQRNYQKYHEAVDNLNIYFQRASIGYQLVENRMIRIDSEYHHSEVVLPALVLLRGDGFETANKEFLSAHGHYRNSEYRDCITNANAAFESVMKVICNQKGWNSKSAANGLIKTLSKEGLIPSYLQSYFRLGLPPLRHNQGSAHGKGEKAEEVSAYKAGYALHLAATNILFLVHAAKSENHLT